MNRGEEKTLTLASIMERKKGLCSQSVAFALGYAAGKNRTTTEGTRISLSHLPLLSDDHVTTAMNEIRVQTKRHRSGENGWR